MANERVAVVGAGNVGLSAIMTLALVGQSLGGPWEILVVDFDRVSEKDSGKGYHPSLVGRFKADAAREMVRRAYGDRAADTVRPVVAAAQSVPGLIRLAEAVFNGTDSTLDAAFVSEEARNTWELRLSTGILGVNIMVALSNFGELVKTALDEGIDVIFSGAGLPLDLPRFRRGGDRTKLVPIVSSGRAARIIAKRWTERYDYPPDAVVVEGPLAGGHLGFKPGQISDPAYALERLLAEVLVEIKPFEVKAERPIPVVVGGGIYTGADIHRFMRLGAAGVPGFRDTANSTSRRIPIPSRTNCSVPPTSCPSSSAESTTTIVGYRNRISRSSAAEM